MKTINRCLFVLVLVLPAAGQARDYRFDGRISPPVLSNYLSRAMTVLDLLTEKGDLADNLRMLRATGVKFAGRSVYLWGSEADLPRRLELARKNSAKVRQADPDIILQAGIFEIVTRQVERLAVPDWAFTALGRPVERRNFRYKEMIYADGRMRDPWGRDASVPDVSRPETKLWFYYLAVSYLDAGIEAFHFGQAELMNRNDPKSEHWGQVLGLVRAYAARHARRHFVLCDAHVPGGGLLYGDRLLFDFHSFPLRIAEVPDRPQEGVLRVGFVDSIYGRSRGGLTPSGWRCDHLPYLVELDNWGVSDRPGQPRVGGCWIWGYDEISWFAHQDAPYRNAWLRYAWRWVREHDPAGFLQMPGSRCLHCPVNGKDWYFANTPSAAVPDGFGQEETIRAIWAADSK
jgi:hypothetical protein